MNAGICNLYLNTTISDGTWKVSYILYIYNTSNNDTNDTMGTSNTFTVTGPTVNSVITLFMVSTGVELISPQYQIGLKINLELIDGSGNFIINSQTSSNYSFAQTSFTPTYNSLWTTYGSAGNTYISPFGYTGGSTGTIIQAHSFNANNYNSTSDYRVKEYVSPLKLEEYSVDKLKPVYFKFKNDGKESIGLIAHELQEYYPFLVEGEKDGENIQRVNYIGLIGVLIREVQDLKKDVKELKQGNNKN